MHKFDLNGWKYGESRIEDLAEQVRRHVPGAKLPTHQGGKAFGLSFARTLANDVFMVLEWDVGTRSYPLCLGDLQRKYHDGAFVRSNAQDEDWGDPRAGVHESKYARFAYNFQQVVDQLMADCGGVVVQSYCPGLGVVVDLGWSELLQRNILRVAVGGASQEGRGTVYTSPTWDNEASVGLYDAHTGEAIVDAKTGHFDVARLVDKMVKVVVPRLIHWDIDFGLQFEFVVEDTKMTQTMRASYGEKYEPFDTLVQIRPSPGFLQGAVDLPAQSGTLLATTGKVNKPGSVCGDLVCVKQSGSDTLFLATRLYLAGQCEAEFPEEVSSVKGMVDGKILVWESSSLQRYGGSFYQVLGAARLGVIAQLSGDAVFINSAHGIRLPVHRTNEYIKPVFEEARDSGLLLAIGNDAVFNLLRESHWGTTPLTLQILSDGLVGQVYQL